MARVTKACSVCDGVVTFTFGTMSRHGELYWGGGERCNKCSHALEIDGRSAPDDLRQVEIDQDGSYGLKCSTGGKSSQLYKIIRKYFDLSISDIRQRSDNSDCILFEGIKGEVDQIKYYADIEGLSCEVVRL